MKLLWLPGVPTLNLPGAVDNKKIMLFTESKIL